MSEDTATLENDGQGIWRDPAGIVALGETGNSHYDLDHGVTLICDSHRKLLTRLAVLRGAKKSGRRRMPCPECGRTCTVYLNRRRDG
jgi:hypothetical protein